jgi:high-affinity nickel-transport protein
MIGLLSIVALGFFLGMRHATDPDHVIAVATIVTRQRKLASAALIGAYWGLGHTLTIFVVGAGIILFNLVIPVRLGLSMELSVGMMLVLLGGLNVVSFFRAIPASPSELPIEPETHLDSASTHDATVHSHLHHHGSLIHSHTHVHTAPAHAHRSGLMSRAPLVSLDRFLARFGLYQYLRPLLIGTVHGLAGSAAVALLVLATIRDPRWAIAYLLVFGIGTIAGMMVITVSLASTLRFVGGRSDRTTRNLALISGLLSVAFGLFVVYQMGFVSGLFTTHPIWTPE